MKMINWRAALAATTALAFALSPATAATAVSNPSLSSSAFSDLGAGPMLLGGGPGGVVYVQADVQPSIVTAGFVVQPGDPPACIGGTAKVWARATVPAGTIAVVSAGTGVACGSGSGGGGGGAITAASGSYAAGALSTGAGVDGWNLTEGATGDAAYAGSGSASLVAGIKGLYAKLAGALVVTGTFWQATQPVSIAAAVSVKPTATSSARNFPGCTVGVSSAQCLAAATSVSFVQIQNTSASASIACAWGATAVLNSSGSFQLSAGQSASWGPNTGGIPSGALNCIASGASTPAYVEWN